MKKICSVILALSLMMSMIVSLTACSNKVKSSELTMWIGESVVGENEFEMPQDSWIVQELVNEYSTIYGTHIKLTYFEDEEAMIQLIANNARMGNEIPDVACVFSSENIREMTDVLYPLTNDVTEEEKEHIMFWETVNHSLIVSIPAHMFNAKFQRGKKVKCVADEEKVSIFDMLSGKRIHKNSLHVQCAEPITL